MYVINNTVSMKGCDVTNSAEDGVVLSGEGEVLSTNTLSNGNMSQTFNYPAIGGEEMVYVSLPGDVEEESITFISS